jgi:hypothetical protein
MSKAIGRQLSSLCSSLWSCRTNLIGIWLIYKYLLKWFAMRHKFLTLRPFHNQYIICYFLIITHMSYQFIVSAFEEYTRCWSFLTVYSLGEEMHLKSWANFIVVFA